MTKWWKSCPQLHRETTKHLTWSDHQRFETATCVKKPVVPELLLLRKFSAAPLQHLIPACKISILCYLFFECSQNNACSPTCNTCLYTSKLKCRWCNLVYILYLNTIHTCSWVIGFSCPQQPWRDPLLMQFQCRRSGTSVTIQFHWSGLTSYILDNFPTQNCPKYIYDKFWLMPQLAMQPQSYVFIFWKYWGYPASSGFPKIYSTHGIRLKQIKLISFAPFIRHTILLCVCFPFLSD